MSERLVTNRLALEPLSRETARAVLAGNVPSRRALERAGFTLEREADGLRWYALGPPALPSS